MFTEGFVQPMRSASKKSEAYDLLKQRIVHNEIQPMTSFTEQALSQELGISKTPIREALKELEKEGFVIIVPNRGCFVSSISVEDVRDVFEIREILECASARMAAERAEKAQFQQILNNHTSFLIGENDSIKDKVVSGYEIHSLIVRSIGNKRISEFYDMLQSHIVRIRLFFMSKFGEERLRETSDEHKLILSAIVAGDADAAEATMRSHLRNSQARIRSLI